MDVTGNSDINNQAFKGSLWSILEKFSILIVQFIVGIVLARLLDPKDYGLVALTMIFSAVCAAITDGGFEKSLIHRQELTLVQISTVFWINLLLGMGMVGILVLSAPALAVFFREPKLTIVLQVSSIGILINAIGQTPSALLRKEFKFKKISYAHMVGSLIGGLTGVILAYNGYGVWALVYSTLISQVIMLLGYILYSTWRLEFTFSYSSIKSMLPYGLNILYGSIVFFALQQFNNLIVGRYYTKTDLGLYHRGSRFPELVSSIIEGVVLKIAFPLLSRFQEDNVQLNGLLQKIVKILAFVSFPILTILFVNARDITIALFTAKWAGSIFYLQLFCLIKCLYPIIIIYKETLLVKGYAKLSSKILTVFSIVEVLLVLLVIQYGIAYIIMVTAAITVAQYVSYVIILSRKISLSVAQQIFWLSKYLVIAVITGVGIYFLNSQLDSLNDSLYIKVAIKVVAGLILYMLLAFSFNVDEVAYIKKGFDSLVKKLQLRFGFST